MEQDELISRVKEVMAKMCIAPSVFAKRSLIDPSNFNKMLDGQQKITNKTLKKISDYNHVNLDWLLTGEGEMLKPVSEIDSEKKKFIRYYPEVNGTMGEIELSDEPDERKHIDIWIPGYEDCTHAINAYGDSMSPLIKSGQVVIMKRWEESYLAWGRIYCVVTKGGYRTIKRIYPSQREGFVELRSENTAENPPFEIPTEDITQCYLVKGWICRNEI